MDISLSIPGSGSCLVSKGTAEMSYAINQNAVGIFPPHKTVIIYETKGGVRPDLKETLLRSP